MLCHKIEHKIGTAEAEAPSHSDELLAMHHWATAMLFHEAPLEDPNKALAACRTFLEISDGRNWTRPDVEIAGIVLDAAVENPDGPILSLIHI